MSKQIFNDACARFLKLAETTKDVAQLQDSLRAVFDARNNLIGLHEFEWNDVTQDMQQIGVTAQALNLQPVI